MGQNSRATLIYALVARGMPPVVVAEYTAHNGNFNSIAHSGNINSIAYQCLQKLPSSDNKFTYNCDAHTFNYFIHDGFTYCVVAEESVGRQIPMAFLEHIKDDFTKAYGGGESAAVPAHHEYGLKLKEHMEYFIEHPEEISKLVKVKAQVSEVKGVMLENIEKVLDRGQKIELLVDKTENLHHQAKEFKSSGTRLHRKMWLQNSKMKLVVLTILIVLILIIVLSTCGGVLWKEKLTVLSICSRRFMCGFCDLLFQNSFQFHYLFIFYRKSNFIRESQSTRGANTYKLRGPP